jgi:beta,beta-carotene 9',10'-dioxygenase
MSLEIPADPRVLATTARASTADVESPHDVSALAPFRSHADDEAVRETQLRGQLPAWLRGDLLRTAPAVFATGGWEAHHWFDALGTLYAFRIGADGVSYRQRLMDSEVARQARAGRAPRASFGTPIARSAWRRLLSPVPEVTDNTNVNVVSLGDQRVALTESPHQWAVDPETLALTRPVTYDDGLGELAMLAHPHFDFARGRVVNLATRIGARSELVVYEHASDSRQRSVVGRIPLRRIPYVHAFGLTERHVIVIGHPFEASPTSLLWSNRGFIDHFAYRAEQATTLYLVDRASGEVRRHAAPAGFVFHVVNAFEEDGATSVDVALYPDARVVDELRTAHIHAHGFPGLLPSITRWTMRPGVAEAQVETLLAEGFEFPSVSYRQVNGRRHTVSWGARIGRGASSSSVVRSSAGAERSFAEGGFVFGEPVFVARPGASDEDDGVVLSVGSHRTHSRSAMAVLDARSLDVLAWAEVPLPIPLGFHGSFFRG